MSEQLEQQGLVLQDEASRILVTDGDSRDVAAEFLISIKTQQKEVEAAMDPQCKTAYAAWQTANAQKKKYLAPYLNAEKILKSHIGKFDLIQIELQEKADAKAAKVAEQREAKERKRLQKLADKHRDAGNDEKADDFEDRVDEVFVPTTVANIIPEKAEGVTSRKDFDLEVTNKKELLKWLMTTGMDLDKVVTLKVAPIKQYITLTQLKTVPGLRITPKAVISAKGR
jgi:hypothetical protein